MSAASVFVFLLALLAVGFFIVRPIVREYLAYKRAAEAKAGAPVVVSQSTVRGASQPIAPPISKDLPGYVWGTGDKAPVAPPPTIQTPTVTPAPIPAPVAPPSPPAPPAYRIPRGSDQTEFAPGPQTGWIYDPEQGKALPLNAAGRVMAPGTATMDEQKFLRSVV